MPTLAIILLVALLAPQASAQTTIPEPIVNLESNDLLVRYQSGFGPGIVLGGSPPLEIPLAGAGSVLDETSTDADGSAVGTFGVYRYPYDEDFPTNSFGIVILQGSGIVQDSTTTGQHVAGFVDMEASMSGRIAHPNAGGNLTVGPVILSGVVSEGGWGSST